MKIRVTGFFEPDEEAWMASCPALGIYTCGDTREDAEESLKEAILGYLEVVDEGNGMAELHRTLEERASREFSFENGVAENEWLESSTD